MQKSKNNNVLIIGKRTPKVVEMERIFTKHSYKVHLASAGSDFNELFPRDHFSLIVFTDSCEHRPDRDFIVRLRKNFPQVKFLGLFDEFNREAEIAMRSAGVIFLGSYDYFSRHSPNILCSALHSGEEI